MESEKVTAEEEKIVYQERKRILFLGLPWTFTKYSITADMLTVNTGILRTEENDCYMYKVQDVMLTKTLMERIFGLATVVCYTGDVNTPQISLVHIKYAKEIKSYLLKASETARLKRRTINTQDIGAGGLDLDGDGIPD